METLKAIKDFILFILIGTLVSCLSNQARLALWSRVQSGPDDDGVK